jgi:predicted RNA polymerase sigma factor
MSDAAARPAAERAARDAYGRLLAILSARTHDIAASEDALADAMARALERWPADGIPQQPAAWLLAAARHRKLDAWRHTRVQDKATQTLMLLAGEVDDRAAHGQADDRAHGQAHGQAHGRAPGQSHDQAHGDDGAAVPDERLRMLFVCAHPAIDVPARAPLMLQTVLGIDAARMAGAFLTSPSTLAQRLVRAKARIRAAGVPFEYPQARELPHRLRDVLDGIYAAYGTGWDDVDGADALPRGLTHEAIDLCRILCRLMPGEPEPLGLLALMVFCDARLAARRSDTGAYVPLDQQDITRWNHELLAEAEHHLRQASTVAGPVPAGSRHPVGALRAPGRRARAARNAGVAVRRTAVAAPEHRRAGEPRVRAGRCARAGSRPAGARRHSRGRGDELPAVLGGTRAPACGRRRARGRPAGLRPCDRAEHQRGGADVSGREVAAALSRRGVVNAH